MKPDKLKAIVPVKGMVSSTFLLHEQILEIIALSCFGWLGRNRAPRGPNKSGPKSRSCSSTKPERVPLASSSVCVLWSFFLLFFYKGERLRCFCCSTSTFALVSWLRFLFWKGEDAFPHKMQTNSREVCWAACSFSVLQSTDKDRCVSPWDSCSLQTNSRVVCWAAWAQAPIVFQLTVDCCQRVFLRAYLAE